MLVDMFKDDQLKATAFIEIQFKTKANQVNLIVPKTALFNITSSCLASFGVLPRYWAAAPRFYNYQDYSSQNIIAFLGKEIKQ